MLSISLGLYFHNVQTISCLSILLFFPCYRAVFFLFMLSQSWLESHDVEVLCCLPKSCGTLCLQVNGRPRLILSHLKNDEKKFKSKFRQKKIIFFTSYLRDRNTLVWSWHGYISSLSMTGGILTLSFFDMSQTEQFLFFLKKSLFSFCDSWSLILVHLYLVVLILKTQKAK